MIEEIRIERIEMEKIPEPCNSCLYWETIRKSKVKRERAKDIKKKWFVRVLKEFGNCGFIAFFNNEPVGYAEYAPPEYLPNIKEYLSGPPSKDAVFISCLYIPRRNLQRKGIGRLLLKRIVLDLKDRSFKVIETFARRDSANNPSGPVEFYLKNGFRIVKEQDDFPLMRREI